MRATLRFLIPSFALSTALFAAAPPHLAPRPTPATDPRPATCGDCDDHDPCTDDSCDEGIGACQHLPTGSCYDDNECTDDLCDSDTGCYYLPNDGPCYVPDPCMLDGVCSGGTCHAEPRDCSDDDPCTDESCEAGHCVLSPRSCDDGNACTDDFCDPKSGDCVSVPDSTNGCSDGNACTLDHCVGGACVSTPVACDDGLSCTADSCNPATGACVHSAASCDDQNPCTTDSCTAQGCVHAPAPDGTACWNGSFCWFSETCSAGVCQGGASIQCTRPQDSNPCNRRTCNRAPGGQCELVVNCSDGISCTEDYCTQPVAQCIHTVSAACTDGCELRDLRFEADRKTLTWSPPDVACPEALPFFMWTLARGTLATLPSGYATTLCAHWMTQDATVPPLGSGFWYLVRASHNTGLYEEWFTWGSNHLDGAGPAERQLSCY